MVVLGLFLMHLATFVAAFAFVQWLVRWLGVATTTEAVVSLIAAFGAAATIFVLISHRRGGVIVAVAIAAFWAFVIFGAARPTALSILTVAASALLAASAVALVESLIARLRAARKPP